MQTENLSTLKIHKLTQEQYDREAAAGRLDPNALYLTEGGGEGSPNAVLYTPQTLTDTQKAQARQNIGAVGIGEAGGGVYYATLADAIQGENDVEFGPVTAFTTDNYAKTVVLLDDVNVDTPIGITEDIALVLNGQTIHLTNADAQFNINANFTINGENGCIEKEDLFEGTVRIFNVTDGSLKISGGSYYIDGTITGSAIAINATSNCKEISIDNCYFRVRNENDDDSSITITNAVNKVIQSQAGKVSVTNSTLGVTAYHRCVVAIHSAGDVEVRNSTLTVRKHGTIKHNMSVAAIITESVNESSPKAVIENSKLSCITQSDSAVGLTVYAGAAIIRNSIVFTDAPGEHVQKNALSIGISASGALTCINSEVTGTHSGIQSTGSDLYVDNCVLNGFCHGGLYLMPNIDNKVYIKDTTLEGGIYKGSYASEMEAYYAHFYFGDPDFLTYGTVYMDGCTLSGRGYIPFVVRQGPDAEHRNILYISNLTYKANSIGPIRLNGYAPGEEGYCEYIGAELKVGINCPISPGNTTRPDCVEITNKLYRKTPTSENLNGDDFEFLYQYIEETGAAQGGAGNSVLFISQELNDSQKAQARKNINAAEEGCFYYQALDHAINGAFKVDSGPIKAFVDHSGLTTIVLQNSISVTTPVDVNSDVNIILNGNIIYLNMPNVQFNINANLNIDGTAEGSAIYKNNITTDTARMFNINSGSLKINGGEYKIYGSLTGSLICINATANCNEISLENCNFDVENKNDDDSSITISNAVNKVIQSLGKKVNITNSTLSVSAYHRHVATVHCAGDVNIFNSELNSTKNGTVWHDLNVNALAIASVNNSNPKVVVEDSKLSCVGQSSALSGIAMYGGEITVINSDIFTDAPGASLDASAYSVGITSTTSLTCINTNIIGTYCAIYALNSDLYVDNCVLDGYYLGGLFLVPNTTNKVYVKDSVLQAGVYSGNYQDKMPISYGCFYVGHPNAETNGSAYMDGCTLKGNSTFPFNIYPGPNANSKTVLYISNIKNQAQTSQSIRLNGGAQGQSDYVSYVGAELKIGVNCPFTPNDTTRPDCAVVTNELYRRTPVDISVTGNDFDALQEYMSYFIDAKLGEIENGSY